MAAADYTDLATLKAYLSISDTNSDAVLSLCITDASRAIDRLCGRPDGDFGPQTFTRTFDVDLPAELVFAREGETVLARQSIAVPPLLSVTTLKTDEDGDGTFETTWSAATDYLLYPLNAATMGRPYREISANPVSGTRLFPIGQNRVQVVGSWGEASAVPSAIRRAALVQATRYFKRKDAPFGIYGDSDVGVVARLPGLDQDVQAILREGRYLDQWVIA